MEWVFHCFPCKIVCPKRLIIYHFINGLGYSTSQNIYAVLGTFAKRNIIIDFLGLVGVRGYFVSARYLIRWLEGDNIF